MLPLWLEGSSFQQVLLARLPPPSMLFDAIIGSQGSSSYRLSSGNAGYWHYRERYNRDPILEPLLEHQSNSF